MHGDAIADGLGAVAWRPQQCSAALPSSLTTSCLVLNGPLGRLLLLATALFQKMPAKQAGTDWIWGSRR